ncbi:flagellar export protein FliJ [Leeia sp.]|uniref:flagellar export protein FliJ n=1 Tax=Leeia sp. TaxID=2884678 RepID=UPI0035B21E9B
MAEFPFLRLLELAREQREEAARGLQASQARVQAAEQQLATLQQYRQDYQQRLGGQQQQGMAVTQWRDYLLFLGKLDTAIAQQQQECERCEQLRDAAREQWLEREQKVQAFEALQQRHDQAELRKEARREQKQTDEFASRKGSVSRH